MKHFYFKGSQLTNLWLFLLAPWLRFLITGNNIVKIHELRLKNRAINIEFEAGVVKIKCLWNEIVIGNSEDKSIST